MTGAQERIKRWREDPVFFVHDELKVQDIEPWQEEYLRAFASNDANKQRIALKACKGVGKTAAESWSILNFMTCYAEPGEHPKGCATSITEQNIDDNLWPEISKFQRRSEYLTRAFTWTKTRYFCNQHPETWFFSKRAWPKSADLSRQADTLAGFHAKYLLFVLDESGGIPMGVMAAAEGGLATMAPGHWLKIVQGGNPTHREGPLYNACTVERALWYVITITGDPDDPRRCKRQSIDWARKMIKRWGRENPYVLINVLGEFPPSSINALLGPEHVEAAMGKQLPQESYIYSQKRLGVDVALYGDDRTVLFPRQGIASFMPEIMRTQEPADIAARIINIRQTFDQELTFVDCGGGYGSGVVSYLKNLGDKPVEVFAGQSAIEANVYANRRAEMWFEMANWIKKGGSLPNIPEIMPELTTPTYTTTKAGKLIIEPKEFVKERLGYSPDIADAFSHTFFIPEAPAANALNRTAAGRGRVRQDTRTARDRIRG